MQGRDLQVQFRFMEKIFIIIYPLTVAAYFEVVKSKTSGFHSCLTKDNNFYIFATLSKFNLTSFRMQNIRVRYRLPDRLVC